MADEKKQLTMDEAMAILDRHAAEAEGNTQSADAKKKGKVKDLIKEGAKQGHGGLNKGARRQLEQLEEEGY